MLRLTAPSGSEQSGAGGLSAVVVVDAAVVVVVVVAAAGATSGGAMHSPHVAGQRLRICAPQVASSQRLTKVGHLHGAGSHSKGKSVMDSACAHPQAEVATSSAKFW
mmetsp:Transcript_21122/g.59584  ORF Transcript_21122/g.59584 Transcript_21122/m.59584 type:complete len:107 (-) Transcript_21122:179-499(-)